MASRDSLVEAQAALECLVTSLYPGSRSIDEDHLRLLLKISFYLRLSFQVASEAFLNLLSVVVLFH